MSENIFFDENFIAKLKNEAEIEAFMKIAAVYGTDEKTLKVCKRYFQVMSDNGIPLSKAVKIIGELANIFHEADLGEDGEEGE